MSIYLDNAATSFPKPPEVAVAMSHFLTHVGANAGRGAHQSALDAARMIYYTREAVADLFGLDDPLRVVFGHNITDMLNLVLYGLLCPGDHVITTGLEHNAMMRPLRHLETEGVTLSVIPTDRAGQLDTQRVKDAIQPNTRLIAILHASNVIGTLLPVREIGAIARTHDLLFLVDSAQSAGNYPLDMIKDQIDLLAFTGHKSLLGSTGTGGLLIGERVPLADFQPLRRGGTGSRSEDEYQPDFLPDKFESGTPNAVGLAGLRAGIEWIKARGMSHIRQHESALIQQLINGLQALDRVCLYGTGKAEAGTSTLSFNIQGLTPAEVGARLNEDFGIQCRVGLHCAPAAHRILGTFPAGTVRFSPGVFSTIDEINTTLSAVETIAKENCV